MHGFENYAWGFAGGLCCWKAWLLVGWAAGGFCFWQACSQYYNFYFALYDILHIYIYPDLRDKIFFLRGYLRELARSCILKNGLN